MLAFSCCETKLRFREHCVVSLSEEWWSWDLNHKIMWSQGCTCRDVLFSEWERVKILQPFLPPLWGHLFIYFQAFLISMYRLYSIMGLMIALSYMFIMRGVHPYFPLVPPSFPLTHFFTTSCLLLPCVCMHVHVCVNACVCVHMCACIPMGFSRLI